MALSFTDQQLKDISKEALNIPAEIIKQTQNLVDIDALKTDLQNKDNGNKVFSDNLINILAQYHQELKKMSGPTRTNYTEATIISGAKLEDGNPHFPTAPIWVNFQPKKADANEGLPITSTTPNESTVNAEVQPPVNQLVTGYTDGATTTTLATAYVAGQFETTLGGYVLGQRLIVDDVGVSAFGIITALDTPAPVTGVQTITLNVLVPPAGVLGVGARVRNFHPGYTDNQRTNVDPVDEPEYFAYLKNLIDTKVAAVVPYLDDELTALNANDAGGAEATQIATAKNNVTGYKNAITTWQAAAAIVRFGDTFMNPLLSAINNRPAQITSRDAEIVTALGSITQNADGSFSGAGNYFKLFNFVNIRINKVEGSLSKFFNVGMVRVAVEQKIATLNDKQTEYNNQFVIRKFTADSDGSTTIKLDSVTGLNNGDTIKIMDDVQAVLTVTISSINVLDVVVSAPVTGYLVSKIARVVKQL